MEAGRICRGQEAERVGEDTIRVMYVQEALEEVSADTETDASDVVNAHDPFGWMPCLDPVTNAVFYVHSFTGEVRWSLTPDRVQPARTTVPQSATAPMHNVFAPSFVMLPGGITPTGQTMALDSWRGGYELFPLSQSSQGTLQETYVPEDQAEELLKHKHRVLPCTWELSDAGPPFLDQFPVAVLQPIWLPPPQPCQIFAEANIYGCTWNATPLVMYSPPSSPEMVSSVVQASIQTSDPDATPTSAISDGNYFPHQRKRTNRVNESSHIHKEHNRRGYSFRQARNIMKRLGLQSSKTSKDVQNNSQKPLLKHEGDSTTQARAVYQPSQRTTIRVN